MKFISVLSAIVLTMILLCMPISAYSSETESALSFEEWDCSKDNHYIITELNKDYDCNKYGLSFTYVDVNSSDYFILNTADICDYTGGKFKDFTEKSHKSIQLLTYKDGYIVVGSLYADDVSTYKVSNILPVKGSVVERFDDSVIDDRFAPFGDMGNAYYFSYYGRLYSVITDINDIPRYVVFYDITYAEFDELSSRPELYKNSEALKAAEAFDRLYKRGFGQLVFDFDFVKDAFSAAAGKLPDDYLFEPHGLESELKNKIKAIDGTYYYFNNQGICTGRYTGWTKSSKGKRYYLKGKYLTGKQDINGKSYSFDKNGYLL